jgi:quercetin dioxygenase-like cupin family protein
MAMGFDAGGELPAHGNPGEAILRVVRGRVRLSWSDQQLEAGPGMLVRIPDATHRVEALEPSAILLTAVSLPGGHAH